MKNISLILILLSLTLINSASAKGQWIKDQKGCNLWWDKKNTLPKSVRWTGKCKNGYASGKGVARYQDTQLGKDVYKGEMKKGKPHGKGRYTWANGDNYKGHFKHSKIHGHGYYRWGKKKPSCTSCWKSFHGDFVNNKINTGLLTYANGTTKTYKKKTKDYLSDAQALNYSTILYYGAFQRMRP